MKRQKYTTDWWKILHHIKEYIKWKWKKKYSDGVWMQVKKQMRAVKMGVDGTNDGGSVSFKGREKKGGFP